MAEKQQIEVDAKYLELISQILKKYLPNSIVWAYGSRAKFTADKYSDLDLVAFDASDIQIGDTLEAFENSIVPFRVSLMRWEKLPEDFKKNIQDCYVEIPL